MTYPWPILVASADLECRRMLISALHRDGLDPICASTVGECREIVTREERIGLVFCDRHLADGDYRDVLNVFRPRKPAAHVVVTAPEFDWDAYLEAMRLGAFDVIASPCRPTDVEWMVSQSRRNQRNELKQALGIPPISQTTQQPTVRRIA
jgi:DNA-binding NtrC family response regulator